MSKSLVLGISDIAKVKQLLKIMGFNKILHAEEHDLCQALP